MAENPNWNSGFLGDITNKWKRLFPFGPFSEKVPDGYTNAVNAAQESGEARTILQSNKPAEKRRGLKRLAKALITQNKVTGQYKDD